MDQHAHLRHEAIICGVSNAFFNGIAAWLMLRAGPELSWTGEPSFLVDIMATAFLLPFIVAAIVIPLQRRKLRLQQLSPINLGPDSALQKFSDKLPTATFLAALSFAMIGLALVAPTTLLALYFSNIEAIEPTAYAVFKGFWAGAMAAGLVIPMVLVALRTQASTLHPAASAKACQ